MMAGDADEVELFVGQMVALIPIGVAGLRSDQFAKASLRRMFPRSLKPRPTGGAPVKAIRPKTYSVITDAPGHGFLKLRQREIEVRIIPLDLETPEDATVFRVAAVAGRAIRVTGIVEEPGQR